jgi:hypothetical protein
MQSPSMHCIVLHVAGLGQSWREAQRAAPAPLDTSSVDKAKQPARIPKLARAIEIPMPWTTFFVFISATSFRAAKRYRKREADGTVA